MSSDHHGTQNGTDFDVGTFSALTLLIQEINKSMDKSISEIEEKLHGSEVISFAFSLMTSVFAFFIVGVAQTPQNAVHKMIRKNGLVIKSQVEVLRHPT
jgi:hypothetical protein